MPYLLDGNNLIGLVRRTARPTEEDRRAFVAEIAGRLRATRARAVLFFDGPAGERESGLGALTIRRSSGRSADDVIVAEVAASRSPGECLVVTADRELARRVRDAGGQVVPPPRFFERFGATAKTASDPTRPAGSERVDVDDWMRWFGDDQNRGR